MFYWALRDLCGIEEEEEEEEGNKPASEERL